MKLILEIAALAALSAAISLWSPDIALRTVPG